MSKETLIIKPSEEGKSVLRLPLNKFDKKYNHMIEY